jgi:hypothetical protein
VVKIEYKCDNKKDTSAAILFKFTARAVSLACIPMLFRPYPRVWSKKRAVARKVDDVSGKSKENSKSATLFIGTTSVVFIKKRRGVFQWFWTSLRFYFMLLSLIKDFNYNGKGLLQKLKRVRIAL